jgi:hypothetical protein
MNQGQTIDTGDLVYHAPSKERWVVAYVQNGRLAWCGWPEGEADLSDCYLVKKASPESRRKLLEELAAISVSDARQRYAAHRLSSEDE